MIPIIFMTLPLTHDERNLLEALFELYETAVYHLSFQILQNKSDAEDNTIQTFIGVSKVLHRFDADITSKRSKSFIYSIARYDAIDLYRKRSTQLHKDRIDVTEPFISDIPLDDFNYNTLISEMKSVSEPDTELLVLKYVIGLKSREIAAITGLSIGAVEIRLHRAKKHMKESESIQALREGNHNESL